MKQQLLDQAARAFGLLSEVTTNIMAAPVEISRACRRTGSKWATQARRKYFQTRYCFLRELMAPGILFQPDQKYDLIVCDFGFDLVNFTSFSLPHTTESIDEFPAYRAVFASD